MMRVVLVTVMAWAWLGCGPAVQCPGGDATGVSLQSSVGGAIVVDHRVCASGGRDGEGFVSIVYAMLDTGTLSTLQVAVQRLEELGQATCSKDVSVVLYDEPANRLDYISEDWVSDWRDSPPTDCTVTALRAGERLQGTFAGHLRRLKIDGVTAEFLDVAFTFDLVAPRPGT